MKKLLKSKKGVTILEGLIALLLLAMISVGTFGVLLSTSRKSAQPDIREEMMKLLEDNEQRQNDQDFRCEFEREDLESNILFLLEIISCQSVGCRNTDYYGNNNGKTGHYQRVSHVTRIIRLEKNLSVVVQSG